MKRAADPTPSSSQSEPMKKKIKVKCVRRTHSFDVMDKLCYENRKMLRAPTPQTFSAPTKPGAAEYMSSAEFDAAIPDFCNTILERIDESKADHVILWLPSPGRSMFWVTLKCWEYVCDRVDEVRSQCESDLDPYGGKCKGRTAHLFMDDALFTGQQ